MSFIKTISKAEADETVKEMYEKAEAHYGYLPNYTRLFSHRPDVYQAWANLIRSIRQNMNVRRYELATIAAARKMEGTYCMLAHCDNLLQNNEANKAQLTAIAKDFHHAQLSPEEVAVMEFAEKVVSKSNEVTQGDVDHLRSLGLSDAEILDITLAATARSFFSKTLDALNAEPDEIYLELGTELLSALSVGRLFGV